MLLAALCLGQSPQRVADGVGDGGAAALKRTVTEAVNEYLAPIRARRAELDRDRGELRRILAAGNERARAVAEATLTEVRTAMGGVFSGPR